MGKCLGKSCLRDEVLPALGFEYLKTVAYRNIVRIQLFDGIYTIISYTQQIDKKIEVFFIVTHPETNKSPLKNGSWETTFLLGWPFLRLSFMSMSVAKPLIRQNSVSSLLIESHIAWWGNGLEKMTTKKNNKNPDFFRHSLRHHSITGTQLQLSKWSECSFSTSPFRWWSFFARDLSRKKTQK